MSSAPPLTALADLGLTSLEAQTYAFLLGSGAATGYRVAQALGKPAAGIYKTLETLERKGLILVDEGDTRLARAVPPAEMLRGLERRFRDARDRAEEALAAIPAAGGDDRIYQLRSPDQVRERMHAMLAKAERIVVADVFPRILDELRPMIEAAAARGVEVRVKTYAPIRLRGVDVVLHAREGASVEALPYAWVSLVADGAEYLMAALDAGGEHVIQAVWSGSPFLSWIHHCGLESEMIVDRVAAILTGDATVPRIRAAVARYTDFDPTTVPGYRARRERLAPGQSAQLAPGRNSDHVPRTRQEVGADPRRPPRRMPRGAGSADAGRGRPRPGSSRRQARRR